MLRLRLLFTLVKIDEANIQSVDTVDVDVFYLFLT